MIFLVEDDQIIFSLIHEDGACPSLPSCEAGSSAEYGIGDGGMMDGDGGSRVGNYF